MPDGGTTHGNAHAHTRSVEMEEDVRDVVVRGDRQVLRQHLDQAGSHLKLAVAVGSRLALDTVRARLSIRARTAWDLFERRPADSELEQLLSGTPDPLVEDHERVSHSKGGGWRWGWVTLLLLVIALLGLSSRTFSRNQVREKSRNTEGDKSRTLGPVSDDLFLGPRVSTSVFLHQEPLDALLHYPIPVGLGTPGCEPKSCKRCLDELSCRNLTADDLLEWRHRLGVTTRNRARRVATCAVVGGASDGLEAADEKLIDRSKFVFRVATGCHERAGRRTTHRVVESLRPNRRAEPNVTLIRYCSPSAPFTSWAGPCWSSLLASAWQPRRRGDRADQLFISPLAVHDLSRVFHQMPSPLAIAVRVALEICDRTTVFRFGASSDPAAAAERHWLRHLELDGVLSWQHASYVRPTRPHAGPFNRDC